MEGRAHEDDAISHALDVLLPLGKQLRVVEDKGSLDNKRTFRDARAIRGDGRLLELTMRAPNVGGLEISLR